MHAHARPRCPIRHCSARAELRSSVRAHAASSASPVKQTQTTPQWASKYGDNPALSGNWAPVGSEVVLDGLRVDGRLPPSVAGVWLRNGPNPLHEPVRGHHHLFDGPGMIHWIRLRQDGASYGNRWVRTRSFEDEQAAGKRLHVSLSQPPETEAMLLGLAAKLKTWTQPDSPYWVVQSASSANNGVQWHAGRLLATYEAGSAYLLQPGPELRSLGPWDFGGSLNMLDAWTENFSAHSKVCPVTGEMIFISYNLVPLLGPPTVTVGVVGTGGRVEHRAVVPVSRPSLQHDMGITGTRAVLLDGPLVFNLQRSLAGGLPFDWRRAEPLRIGILSRRAGAEACVWIEVPNCFAYHIANCWDDPEHPDRLHVVLCRMAETRALGLALSVGADGSAAAAEPSFTEEGFLHTFVVDVRTGRMVSSTPFPSGPACDFPRVFKHEIGRAGGRYVFAAGEGKGIPEATFDALLRFDLHTGEVVRRQLPPGVLCGDFSLVPPGPGDQASGLGHVLLLTHLLAEERAEMLVLDAEDIGGAPVAVVHVPVRVPFGFHANWVSEAEIGRQWA